MVGCKVKIIKTGEFKKIIETEDVGGVSIFYMDDNTSYCYGEIHSIEDNPTNINEIDKKSINLNKKLVVGILQSDIESLKVSMKKLCDDLYSKKKIKKTAKTINLFGWTITFSKSK
jgi:hypothetical protein